MAMSSWKKASLYMLALKVIMSLTFSYSLFYMYYMYILNSQNKNDEFVNNSWQPNFTKHAQMLLLFSGKTCQSWDFLDGFILVE